MEPATEIAISPDGMQAVIRIPPGAALSASLILHRLLGAGVVHGIDAAALNEAVQPADRERQLVVARGTPPQPPQDARLEVLVDFAVRLAEEDGRVDFHEQGRFHEAEPGTVLARRIPPRPGVPGRRVTGEEIPVPPPRDAELGALAGEATRVVGDELRAERLGLVVRRADGRLDVLSAIEIPGDLDMHYGNIRTRLPVIIRGDILAGFAVKTASDLTVQGAIEDARISVRGDLRCRGILPGRHRVKAHGDIHAHHIMGREIKCRHLAVANDLRGAVIYAVGDVRARLIVSTRVQCGGSIEVDELGHPAEHGTVVQAGYDPLAVALWRLAAREHQAIVAEAAEAATRVRTLAQAARQADPGAVRARLEAQLREAIAVYAQRIHCVEDCERVLANAALRIGNNPQATITVRHCIHPGVEIAIGAEARLMIAKPLGRTVFRLHEGRIVWS
ncbi:MAG: FapA family protein [Planctomycetota bacterium]|nr:FapA family protein [Planctomycetota bacterium]MCX8038965.1 FapA family protein [Planctomycetota bacterium]